MNNPWQHPARAQAADDYEPSPWQRELYEHEYREYREPEGE